MFKKPFIVFDNDDPPASPPPEPKPNPPKDTGPSETPPSVTYDRFDAVNKEKKRLEAELKKIQDTQAKATEAKLKEQQKWQELAETREKELEAVRLEQQRLQVALDKKLPPSLANRLQGATVEEMQADADALLEFVKQEPVKGVPDNSPGGPAPQKFNLEGASPSELRDKIQEARKKGKSLTEILAN